jgi:hypothetical protein
MASAEHKEVRVTRPLHLHLLNLRRASCVTVSARKTLVRLTLNRLEGVNNLHRACTACGRRMTGPTSGRRQVVSFIVHFYYTPLISSLLSENGARNDRACSPMLPLKYRRSSFGELMRVIMFLLSYNRKEVND